MARKLSIMLICAAGAFAGKYHPALTYMFPLPGSQLLSPKTTIILRFNTEYLNQVAADIVEVRGTGRVYTGRFFSPQTEEH